MGFKLSDLVYNLFKWLGLIALPALATFYGVIGKVWDLPYTAEIVTTITALGTLIGTLIGVSQYKINKEKNETETEQTTENS